MQNKNCVIVFFALFILKSILQILLLKKIKKIIER